MGVILVIRDSFFISFIAINILVYYYIIIGIQLTELTFNGGLFKN